LSLSSTAFRSACDGLLLACLSLGALAFAAREALAPREAAAGVAVIFAPWTTQDAVLSRAVAAGGRFVRFGPASFVAIVVPDDAQYSSRVEGAWLVADPKALAACWPGAGEEGRRT
jgi:hypothetical protein